MLSPLTHPVVRRELVYDKAIQERIDLIRDGSVGRPTLILLVLIHTLYRIVSIAAGDWCLGTATIYFTGCNPRVT